MTLEFKSIDKMDYDKYIELSQICFPHVDMSFSLFKWHFLDCPSGPRRSYVLEKDDSFIGLMSALPIKIKHNNTIKNGTLFTNGMLHPDYRGKNIFIDLVCKGINEEKKKKSEILLVVPSKISYKSTIKTGYTFLGNLDFIAKFFFKIRKNRCIRIDNFDSDIDKLMDQITQRTNFLVYKDYKYLNWRYTKRPNKNYKFYITKTDDEITGFMVISNYDDRKYLKTHIVDLQAINFVAFKELIACAEGLAVNRHELNCWQITNSIYEDWFKKVGFIPTTEKDVLLINMDSNIQPLNSCYWWFSLGDNDVY
jgi:hypothetical protein